MENRYTPAESEIKILAEIYEPKPRDDSSLIDVTSSEFRFAGTFNTLENPMVRELTVSGIKLAWNGTSPILENLLVTRDVTKITILADEVVISKKLEWKGADVVIFARLLTFTEDGCISTEPEPYPAETFSEERDERGYPIEGGAIKAKDGREGQPGGSITLNVLEVQYPQGKYTALIANGGKGERGESGGLMPGNRGVDGQIVRFSDLKEAVENTENHHGNLGQLRSWGSRSGDGHKKIYQMWKSLCDLPKAPKSDGTDAAQIAKDSAEYVAAVKAAMNAAPSVVDVHVSFMYQDGLERYVRVLNLPGQTTKRTRVTFGHSSGGDDIWKEMTTMKGAHIPQDGLDAYPSGKTGAGGRGGIISIRTPAAHEELTPQKKLRLNRLKLRAQANGGLSERSKKIEGGPAGKPTKFRRLFFTLTEYHIYSDGSFKDKSHYVYGSTNKGKDAEGSDAGPGKVGSILMIQSDFFDRRLLAKVVAYARHCFKAGQREMALRIIKPYCNALRDRAVNAVPIDMRAPVQNIMALEQALANPDRDFYGNPPGWVPRFSAGNYLSTYISDRKFSYGFALLMERAMSKIDALEHKSEVLAMAETAVNSSIIQNQKEFGAAFDDFYKSRAKLDKAKEGFGDAQTILSELEDRAQEIATELVLDQVIVKTVFDVTGSVLEAIPVYQPAFQIAGSLTKGVGNAVQPRIGQGSWSASEVLGTLGSISKSAGKTLGENQAALSQVHKDSLTADDKAQEKIELNEEIKRLQNELSNDNTDYEAKVAKAVEGMENDETLKFLTLADAEAVKTYVAGRKDGPKIQAEYDAYVNFSESRQARNRSEQIQQKLDFLESRLSEAQQKTKSAMTELAANAGIEKHARAKHEIRVTQARAEQNEHADKVKRQKALLKEVEEHETNEKRVKKEQSVKKIVEGATMIANGLGEVMDSVATLAAGVDPESDEVKQAKATLLANNKRYAEAQNTIEIAQKDVGVAIEGMRGTTSQINSISNNLVTALQSSIDISRAKLSLSQAIDPKTKASIANMHEQALARMDYYLYLFRKAYMYEYCVLPDKSLADLNELIRLMDKQQNAMALATEELTRLAARNEASTSSIGELSVTQSGGVADARASTLEALGDAVLGEALNNLARTVLDIRQSKGATVRNTLHALTVPAKVCEQLTMVSLENGGSTAEIDEAIAMANRSDARAFFSKNDLLRITQLQILDGGFVYRPEGVQKGTLRIVAEFGRRFVLRRDGAYYAFRLADTDAQLKFGFNATLRPADDDGFCRPSFTRDGITSSDPILDIVTQETADKKKKVSKKIDYTEISPSFLASVRFSIEMGANKIASIEKFEFDAEYRSK